MELPEIILLDKVTITPPYVHFCRRPEEYIYYYIMDGTMHITENEVNYILEPGDFLLLEPQYEHYGTEPDHCTYFYIHFHQKEIEVFNSNVLSQQEQLMKQRLFSLYNNSDTLKQEILFLPKYMNIKKSPQKDFYLQQLYQLRESNQSLQEYHAYLTSCRLMEFFICLSRDYTDQVMTSNKQNGSHSLQMIRQILDYINYSYHENITSKEIENRFHCNFDYINRIFKSETGKTIFVYLNQFRIEQAKLLIASGIPTMASIAEQVGYRDIYYFSKVFKKYNGMTPGTYKNHMLSK